MKKIIAIFIMACSSVLLLLSLMLAFVDYEKIRSECISIVQAHVGTRVQIGEVTVTRFPVPKVVLSNIEMSNLINAQTITFDYSLFSLLTFHPKVSKIHILGNGYEAHISSEYKNGIYNSSGIATIKNASTLLNKYSDLNLNNIFEGTAINAEFDIKYTHNNLSLTNLTIHAGNSIGKGEIVLMTDNSGLPSTFNITFDKMHSINGQMSKLNVSGSVIPQSITLDDFSATFDVGGNFKITGTLTNDQNNSSFNGNIRLHHENFNDLLNEIGLSNFTINKPAFVTIDSSILITPSEITLNNSKNLLGTAQISGDISFKYASDTPSLITNLSISDLDLDTKQPIISSMLDYIKSFAYNMKASDYITKFIPIIIPPYTMQFDISLANTKFMGQVLDKASIIGSLDPNKLIIKDLSYTSKQNSLNSNIAVLTDNIKPEIQINVTGGTLSIDDITPDNLLAKLLYIQKNMDFSKVTTNVDGKLDQLNVNASEYTLNNVRFRGTASGSNNSLRDIHFHSHIGNSEIVINGTISCADQLLFNLAYAYNDFDINNILQFLPSDISAQGNISTNGTLSTHGNVMKDLLYNTYLSSNFIAPSLQINHYDIESFVTKIASLTYDTHNMDNDINSITQNNTYSFLKDFVGRYSMENGIINVADCTFFTAHSSGALSVLYNIYTNDYALSETTSFLVPVNARRSVQSSILFDIEKHGQNFSSSVEKSQLEKVLSSRKPKTIESK